MREHSEWFFFLALHNKTDAMPIPDMAIASQQKALLEAVNK
jgi:hypothetical protein